MTSQEKITITDQSRHHAIPNDGHQGGTADNRKITPYWQ